MTDGYFPYDACNQVSLMLETWCARYTDSESAAQISGQALAMVLSEAFRGEKTSTGIYRRLFKHAEFGLRWASMSGGRDVPFGLWKTIPDPGEQQLCEFTRAYACVFMGGELAQLSIQDTAILSQCVASRRHSLEGFWLVQTGSADSMLVYEMVQRIQRAWDDHAHGYAGCCAEYSQLWEHEHTKAHQWYDRWLRETRGGHHGITKQAHHSHHNGAPVAEHLLDQRGRRGADPGQLDRWSTPGGPAH